MNKLDWVALPLALAIFRWLQSAAKGINPKKITDLGTTAGRAVQEASAQRNETPRAWIRRHVIVAITAYALLAGLLVFTGNFSYDAMLIACPAVAIAVSYLWSRYIPTTKA